MIIKRYRNRKLYNTSESKYISIADIVQYVKDNVTFYVIDNDTRTDITEQTLLTAMQIYLSTQAGRSDMYRNIIKTN